MKIAFVVHGPCPAAVDELATALVRARHHVRIFSDTPGERRRPDGVERIVIEEPVGVPALSAARLLGQELGWRLRDSGTQLIHAFGAVAGIAAHIAARDEIPVVQSVGHLAHTERRLGSLSASLSGRMLLERRLLDRAAMIVASGADQAMEILRTGVTPERVVTVPVGIDSKRYPQTPAPDREPGQTLRILHPGGTREDSGIHETFAAVSALSALKGARSAHLTVLAARQEDAEAIRLAVQRWRLSGRVTLRPRVPASAMPGMYVAADVVMVAPRHLSSGRSVLEAMSSARQVVASGCGAMLDAIEHEVTGFLAPPRDAAGLAEALMQAVDAPSDDRQAMVDRAVAVVRSEHSWQQRLPHLLAAYDVVVPEEDVRIPATPRLTVAAHEAAERYLASA